MQSLGVVENLPDLVLLLLIFYDPTIIDGLNELNPQLDLGKLTHKKAVVLATLKETFGDLEGIVYFFSQERIK